MIKINRRLIILAISLSVFLSGCSLPGLSGPAKNTIAIGTMSTSESQIMGNIVKLMIQHYTDAQVEMVNNLGSSIVQHQSPPRAHCIASRSKCRKASHADGSRSGNSLAASSRHS